MPIPNPDRCCVYKIQENTQQEFLGVRPNPPPYVIRWADNDHIDQRWIIVPESAEACRIVNCENGEYMAIGDDGWFVRWEYLDEPGQIFSFANRAGDWWNIRTGDGRYATVREGWTSAGLTAEALHRSGDDQKRQQFRLLAVNERAKPVLEQGQYQPGQIPDVPRLAGYGQHPPEQSPVYFIAETILPATIVHDAGLPDMVLRVQVSPYYILRREQYWDRTRCSGGDPCLYEHDGHTTKHYETEITYGYSSEHARSMEQATSTKLDFEGKFVFGDKTFAIKTTMQRELKVAESTKTKYEESTRAKTTLDIPKERFIVCNWVLVNRYTLLNMNREEVDRWDVVQYGVGISDGYPRPLEATVRPVKSGQ
ncbi:MAG: hypothetical protein ACK2UK_08535 [Candidatus Promineifilaceae bacterium]